MKSSWTKSLSSWTKGLSSWTKGLMMDLASDWRQDIDTAPAALRMTSSTTSGFDNMGTCDDATSVVVAFMRFETKRCRSGGTVWSWVARTYQLGLAFHAVPSTFWLKRSATGAACVA